MDPVDKIELDAMKGDRTKRDNDAVEAALQKVGIMDDFDEETVEQDNEQELVLNEDTGIVKIMTKRAIARANR